MNDKELAGKIVALGVGIYLPAMSGGIHLRSEDGYKAPSAYLDSTLGEFVRDWRVAGALTEKVDAVYVEALIEEMRPDRWQAQASQDAMPTDWFTSDSAPRAIIEACCEALK